MKDYDKNKEFSYLKCRDEQSIKKLQKLPVNSFELIENTPEFDESFIKSYNEESDEVWFFKVDIQYSKKLHDLHDDLQYWKTQKACY